jgi:hypothetical protein
MIRRLYHQHPGAALALFVSAGTVAAAAAAWCAIAIGTAPWTS